MSQLSIVLLVGPPQIGDPGEKRPRRFVETSPIGQEAGAY